jgi:hypothetical protein
MVEMEPLGLTYDYLAGEQWNFLVELSVWQPWAMDNSYISSLNNSKLTKAFFS